jgi:hypothetical protein
MIMMSFWPDLDLFDILLIHGQEPSVKMAGLAETLPNLHDLQNNISLRTVKPRLQQPSLRSCGVHSSVGVVLLAFVGLVGGRMRYYIGDTKP